MRVLIDTNVVFDVLKKRQPHYSASNQILCLCRSKTIEGVVAFHTVANVFYFFGKAAAPFLKDRLLEVVAVSGADNETIKEVLRWGMTDWEDALQAAAAQSAKASFIISRNVKDFKFSRVPAVTPTEFLKRFHPA